MIISNMFYKLNSSYLKISSFPLLGSVCKIYKGYPANNSNAVCPFGPLETSLNKLSRDKQRYFSYSVNQQACAITVFGVISKGTIL